MDEAPNSDRARAVVWQGKDLLITKFAHPSVFRAKIGVPVWGLNEPPELIDAIDSLPVSRPTIQPLQALLNGFNIDLKFASKGNTFPIANDSDLDRYCYLVASTVARCVLDLVSHHFSAHASTTDALLRREVVLAAERMGQSLQYVNIARDISRDAAINRVYCRRVG